MNDPAEPAERKDPYWDQRQRNLGIDTHGETLTIAEIKFVERFLRRGECISWIPRDTYACGELQATYDFYWLSSDGKPWELKSPRKPDYDAIKRRIRDDMGKSKTRFIIDLGLFPCTAILRRMLVAYKKKRQITSLAILSEDGSALDVL